MSECVCWGKEKRLGVSSYLYCYVSNSVVSYQCLAALSTVLSEPLIERLFDSILFGAPHLARERGHGGCLCPLALMLSSVLRCNWSGSPCSSLCTHLIVVLGGCARLRDVSTDAAEPSGAQAFICTVRCIQCRFLQKQVILHLPLQSLFRAACSLPVHCLFTDCSLTGSW